MVRSIARRLASIATALTLLAATLLAVAQSTNATPADGKGVHTFAHESYKSRRHHTHSKVAAHVKKHRKAKNPKKTKSGSGSSGGGTGSGSGSSGSTGPGASGGESSGSGTGGSGSPSSDPFAGIPFYVSSESEPAVAQRKLAAEGKSAEAAEMGKIASHAQAQWFGDWSNTANDVSAWVGAATASGTLPVIVAYDIPWRDCDQYSSGGAASPAAYREFIDAMAQGIAGRRTIVIVEPDALAELSCLSSEQQADYYSLLSYAVGKLGESPNTAVYLDAGNSGWQPAATMAARLRQAGVANARGFSLNVSNFGTTAAETAYGEAIVKELGGGEHFIIDTSRNGNGPAAGGEWCNPPGRALGTPPTASTGNPLVDAYFWIKRPGESDGTCNGGPSAGTFWTQYALGLAQSASW